MMLDSKSKLPPGVVVREVGMRDGLQSIRTVLPTERKREWLREAHAAGMRDARIVRASALRIAGDCFWCGHFHDTRGLGLANVYAALEVGVARFDASLAGIGGCPHAPGASGNVATEDLAFMLASMGRETGIDLHRLLALRAKVAEWLHGETLHGTLWRAGLPKTLSTIEATAVAA